MPSSIFWHCHFGISIHYFVSLGRFIILMTLEPTTAHGTRPFDCTWKELKCEAMTNAVVTSRRRSEIPRTISCVCQFAESLWQNGSVPIYLVRAERSHVLWRDDWIDFFGQMIREVSIPDNVSELCNGCFKRYRSLRRVTFGPSSSLERIGASHCAGRFVA